MFQNLKAGKKEELEGYLKGKIDVRSTDGGCLPAAVCKVSVGIEARSSPTRERSAEEDAESSQRRGEV